MDIDEADKLLAAAPGRCKAHFRQSLLAILGRGTIATSGSARQNRAFAAFRGKQLPCPSQILLTTATQPDMLVGLERDMHVQVERIHLPLHPDYVAMK